MSSRPNALGRGLGALLPGAPPAADEVLDALARLTGQ